jgi:hypothetical protein
MTDTVESHSPTKTSELLEEVRESARVAQLATTGAIGKFRDTLDEAIPEAVQPLRAKLVDAAIDLADMLVAAQYQFNHNLIRSADRALGKSDDGQK